MKIPIKIQRQNNLGIFWWIEAEQENEFQTIWSSVREMDWLSAYRTLLKFFRRKFFAVCCAWGVGQLVGRELRNGEIVEGYITFTETSNAEALNGDAQAGTQGA